MELLPQLRSLSSYQNLLAQLQANKKISGLGLPRSARLPILAALHADLNLPVLLITDRADHALSLFDELGFWVKSPRYLFAEPNPLFYDAAWRVATARLAAMISAFYDFRQGVTEHKNKSHHEKPQTLNDNQSRKN